MTSKLAKILLRNCVTAEFDQKWMQPVLGVDEVGTGAIAGPIYAAGVMFRSTTFVEALVEAGLDDSKRVTEAVRERLQKQIIDSSKVWFSVRSLKIEEVNQLGHTDALDTVINMVIDDFRREIGPGGTILVDGIIQHRVLVTPIVKGDQLSPSIAAASILAKVARDEAMRREDAYYPKYGFAKHKGYTTKQHLEALNKYGPCVLHRSYTSPVKLAAASFLSQTP